MIVPHGDDDDLIAGFGDEGDLFDERFRGSRLPSCWLFLGGCRCQLLFVPLDLYYAPLKILHMESKNGDLLEDDVHF